jgi:hypothetical protein
MANTLGHGQHNGSTLHEAMDGAGIVGSVGIDNLTYDLVALLHEKSKGLEVYEQYIMDALQHEGVQELLERIREEDRRWIRELRLCLSRLLIGDSVSEKDDEEPGWIGVPGVADEPPEYPYD